MMPQLKIKQLFHESETWKRILGFMMDENVILKNRLADILKDAFNYNLLANAEFYQNRLIKVDDWIGLLRNEMVELDKLLQKEIVKDGKLIQKVDHKFNRVRNSIKNAEMEFNKLKADFNFYFSNQL